MGKRIIGMVSGYGDLTQADWLWKQTPEPFGQWRGIQMQSQASRPDFLLLYQFNFHKRLRPAPQPWYRRWQSPRPAVEVDPDFRQVPADRRIFLLREPPLPEVLAANRQNYAHAQRFCGYVSGPDEIAPQPDYMPAIWYVNQPFQTLDQAPPPQKVRFCSWITSGINRTASHRQRLAFLRQLQASGLEIDLYGRGLPAWADSLGPLQDKWSGMAPYYYNLAIENYAGNDLYVSEKLWDALLSWCLPIYYGGGAAAKLLPPGSFLRLPSLDAHGLTYLQEVLASPEAWYEAKAAIAEARQIILHKLNLLNWLADYVAPFDQG